MRLTLDEIVSIKQIGEFETIDISVSGNNLFFANDILTHNSGHDNTDIGMAEVSESFAINMTVDLLIGIIRTEELDQLNQILIKQIANRYAPIDYYTKFVIGRDAPRMKFYDVESVAQNNISNSGNQRDSDNVESTFIKKVKSIGADFKY